MTRRNDSEPENKKKSLIQAPSQTNELCEVWGSATQAAVQGCTSYGRSLPPLQFQEWWLALFKFFKPECLWLRHSGASVLEFAPGFFKALETKAFFARGIQNDAFCVQ